MFFFPLVKTDYFYYTTARTYDNLCGKEAKNYEKRE